MAVGASSVVGQTATPNAWRLGVDTALAADGLDVEWVGPRKHGDPPSNHHDGVAGSSCADHLAGAGRAPRLADVLATYVPTVLVIMIGGNDNRDSYMSEASGVKALVRSANDARPGLAVIVVTVTHARSYVATDQNNWLLGTALPELRAEGIDVDPVDTYSAMADRADWFAPDGHMSLSGYAEAATIIHEPIRQVIRGGTH